MSTAIAIHWNESELAFVVAEHGQIAASSSVAMEPGQPPSALAQSLSQALASYSPGRAKVIVALGRGAIEWQHLSLPPCPAEELTDLVRLQADRDLAAEEELGFDYLPLVGDEQTPYQVLTAAITTSELAKIRRACEDAGLSLERIVPMSVGWPAAVEQAASHLSSGTQIFVTPGIQEANLWTTHNGQVVLFRQVQLPTTDDIPTLVIAVGSELRRTLLALSQSALSQHANSSPTVTLVGDKADSLTALAATLNEQLDASVQSLDVAAHYSDVEIAQLSLASLAVQESQGKEPLVDLLHPHKRPKKQVNVRTYVLAAVAGVLALASIGWTGYEKLQAPLKQADKDQAEITRLEENLDELQEAEKRVLAIREWNAQAANLLVHLEQISQSARPLALNEKGFPIEQDVLIEKIGFDKRRVSIDALARESTAIQPFETRLRNSAYRTQRGNSDPSKTVKGYPWHFKSTIEITPESDTLKEASTEEASS